MSIKNRTPVAASVAISFYILSFPAKKIGSLHWRGISEILSLNQNVIEIWVIGWGWFLFTLDSKWLLSITLESPQPCPSNHLEHSSNHIATWPSHISTQEHHSSTRVGSFDLRQCNSAYPGGMEPQTFFSARTSKHMDRFVSLGAVYWGPLLYIQQRRDIKICGIRMMQSIMRHTKDNAISQ